MPRRIVLLLLVCLVAPAPALAQAALTLEAAVAEARAANPAITQARAALARADAERAVARAAALPRVTFNESWQRGSSPLFAFSTLLGARQFTAADFAVDRLNHPGTIAGFGSRVMVTQTVFDGGRTPALINAATRAREMATSEVTMTEAGVLLDVVRAYGRVLAADADGRAAASAIAAAQEDLRRATSRRDAGTVTDADVLAIAVHLAGAEQQRVAAEGDAAIARAELNRLTGAPIDRAFTPVEPALPAAPSGDVGAYLAEADRARPEIRRAAAAEAMAQQVTRGARAAWSPTVAVRAGYEATGVGFTDRAGAWSAAGELTWSLSLGGAEAAQARAASASLTAARASRADVRASIHVDVVAALRRVESARARVAIGDRAVLAARETHRILRNRYDAGLAAVADVLRAAAAELDATRARARALVDAVVADADLRRAVGRPVGASQ